MFENYLAMDVELEEYVDIYTGEGSSVKGILKFSRHGFIRLEVDFEDHLKFKEVKCDGGIICKSKDKFYKLIEYNIIEGGIIRIYSKIAISKTRSTGQEFKECIFNNIDKVKILFDGLTDWIDAGSMRIVTHSKNEFKKKINHSPMKADIGYGKSCFTVSNERSSLSKNKGNGETIIYENEIIILKGIDVIESLDQLNSIIFELKSFFGFLLGFPIQVKYILGNSEHSSDKYSIYDIRFNRQNYKGNINDKYFINWDIIKKYDLWNILLQSYFSQKNNAYKSLILLFMGMQSNDTNIEYEILGVVSTLDRCVTIPLEKKGANKTAHNQSFKKKFTEKISKTDKGIRDIIGFENHEEMYRIRNAIAHGSPPDLSKFELSSMYKASLLVRYWVLEILGFTKEAFYDALEYGLKPQDINEACINYDKLRFYSGKYPILNMRADDFKLIKQLPKASFIQIVLMYDDNDDVYTFEQKLTKDYTKAILDPSIQIRSSFIYEYLIDMVGNNISNIAFIPEVLLKYQSEYFSKTVTVLNCPNTLTTREEVERTLLTFDFENGKWNSSKMELQLQNQNMEESIS